MVRSPCRGLRQGLTQGWVLGGGGGEHARYAQRCSDKDILPQGPSAQHIFLSIKFTEKEKSKSPGGLPSCDTFRPRSERPTSWRPPSLLCTAGAGDSREARINHCSRWFPPWEPRRRADKGGTSQFPLRTETASAEIITLPHVGTRSPCKPTDPVGLERALMWVLQ